MNESLQRLARPGRRRSDSVPAVELDGKRVLLSGATGGIGQAVAARLADAGAKLVLSSRREAELEELARALPGGARRHEVIVSDLAEAGAAAKLIGEAGDVDVLIANAALPASGLLDDLSPNEIARAIAGQPRGADPDVSRARARAGEEGRGSHRPGRLARGEGRRPRARRSTTRRSSAFAASRSASARTCTRTASVSRSSRPASCARPGCSTTRAPKPPPGVGHHDPGEGGEGRARRRSRKDKVEITVAPRRTRFDQRVRATATPASPPRSSAAAAPTRSPRASRAARPTSAEPSARPAAAFY